MYLEHVLGKCAGTCPLVPNNSDIKTTMHWSLLSGKKMAALVVAIDGIRLVEHHWSFIIKQHHQNNNHFSFYTSHSNNQSDYALLCEQLLSFSLINALQQSNMNLVSDWLKYKFCCKDMLHNHAHNDHGPHPRSSCCDMSHGVQWVVLRATC